MLATGLLTHSTLFADLDVSTRILIRIGIFIVVALVVGLIRFAMRAGR